MTITLAREKQEWLEAQGRAGHDDRVEEAVDRSWARDLVEEGRASIEREGGLSLDEHLRRVARKLPVAGSGGGSDENPRR